MSRALSITVVFLLACGPKPGVKRAQALLDAGDYEGAIAAADKELAKNPNEGELWRLKIRAGLLAGDSEAAVAVYQKWRAQRGSDDHTALSEMAELTLWRGLVTRSTELNVTAIEAIERHRLVRLADEVTDLIASEDDEVAAAAAIAVLNDHPQARAVAAARLRSSNARARAIVVRGISRKILDRAAKEIRDALSDPDAGVRRAAIGGVVRLEDRMDTGPLAKLARSDPDKAVRTRAGRALAKRPYFPDLEIAKVLLNDKFVGARLAGLEIAKAKADTGGRDVLRQAARSDELSVAIRAAVLLGKGPAWKPLFERALAADKWPLRAAALGAVLAATDRDTAIAAAANAIKDAEVGVRLAAARLYVRLGMADAAKPIFEAAMATELSAAMAMIRNYDDPRGRAAIEAMATSDDRSARTGALAAMIELGTKDGFSPALIAALADKAPALRMRAADVLLELLED